MATTGPDAAWAVAKLELSETSRRELQVILSQHKAWLTEATKFITMCGEAAPTDFDLDGATSKYESKNVRKAERALDEKLRALVEDMERMLGPLFGESSRLAKFVQTWVAGNPQFSALSSMVLLVDPALQSLPWEALQLAAPFKGRVSRDFSLHMLHHRLCGLTLPVLPLTTTTTAATTTAAAAAPAAPAAINPEAPVVVKASAFRYLVDPLREDQASRTQGLERPSLAETLSAVIAGTATVGSSAVPAPAVPAPAGGAVAATPKGSAASATALATTNTAAAAASAAAGPVLVPAAAVGVQKWSAVRTKNGYPSTQDLVVSIDSATPAAVRLGTAAATPPPAAAAAAAGEIGEDRAPTFCVFSLIIF
jgi:hypothetical protein